MSIKKLDPCIYTQRMWGETRKEKEMRMEAHKAIVEAIGRGTPAIAWDVLDAEWGLITGYDDKEESYLTMAHQGKLSSLPYKKLGNNGIDILSVSVPGNPNSRNRDEIIKSSLENI